jgi:hypothetical protein
MDKAGLYIDENNPLNNTAEWDVEISKPGTYKVWLSNATRDTLDLRYPDKVRVNLSDSQLEGIPACDKIISNSEDVSYPYFRADSYMGFVNISEAGMYNVQVVSEMVIAKVPEKQSRSFTGKTILIGIMLSPTLK